MTSLQDLAFGSEVVEVEEGAIQMIANVDSLLQVFAGVGQHANEEFVEQDQGQDTALLHSV